jgi:phosphopentomutase
VGVSRSHAGATNARALGSVATLLSTLDRGLVFANLIETDQTFGHRKDVAGFARALRDVDDWLARRLPALRAEDLLIVTADHGVDPAQAGTDHTREYAPLLACSGKMLSGRAGAGRDGVAAGARHDGPLADVGATVLRWLADREAIELPGEPFIS